jgi:hypothetical protein
MFSAQNSCGHVLGKRSRLRTLSFFGIEGFSGAWRLALGALFSFPPYPKSTLGSVCDGLIKVENGLVQTFHKSPTNQKSGPKIRGYKPKSNRHKLKTGKLPVAISAVIGHPLWWLPAGTKICVHLPSAWLNSITR